MIDGDRLVVTGQKIWTGHAHLSDYQELLVRTDPDAAKYKGITWVIADMKSPGIDVRPIRNMAGEDHFCEVFYDEVRIPLSNVVGGLNNGWKVAMATLGIERGAASIPHILEVYNHVEDLIELARSTPGVDGRPALRDEAVASELAQLRADTAALRAMAYMVISRGERSMAVGPDGSIVRLQFSLLVQRLYKAAMDILGPASLEHSPLGGWSHEYLVNFKQTIAGGTSEIQRNIIGERLLGLPRGR